MEKRSCLYLLLFCTLFGAVEAQSEITLTLSPQKYAALPGDLFPVDYIVAWTGEPHAYTVLPPVLPALDWGTATLLKMQAKRDGERHETHLIIGYQAQDAGTYTVPAFDIRLLEGSGDAEDRITAVDETLPTQVVEAAAIEIVFRPSRAGLWIGGIGSGLLLFGGLLWYRARKNRGKETDTPTRSPLEEAQAMLHEA
ncbi:MAG: hypothetical protein KAH38_00650, partial [Candidatus Hydrogenedentes bacterium]|nr:hypothetical protein [Candidatus Hydrogenedentota bacterium]